MISPLAITSLNQGKLYGEKLATGEPDMHRAIVHRREGHDQARNLPTWQLLATWNPFARPAGNDLR